MDEGRLDELGWSMFEDYVVALLKAEFGAGVEAWGRHGDFGRDCYCPSPLRFPGTELVEGPFVFQAKFVAGANATGAKFLPALRKAISAEAARIDARCEAGEWDKPGAYVLVTNCPVQAVQRAQLEQILRAVGPDVNIHILTGRDCQAIARRHSDVRRAFPQIMGLGDLQALIADSVNAEQIARSRAALASAAELANVFVPTAAYDRAWKVLAEHHFVVLEGPPEMGKTAISYMIGAAKAFEEWDVYECRDPDDFFKVHKPERSQYFIVDDAFGRTEYDPSLGKLWERDFGKIIRRLDGRHWVCWTSRRHILERAMRTLDLAPDARKLPGVASVVVDAGRLTVREKVLILYRHAKQDGTSLEAKSLVRRFGRRVVRSVHFTPERIRRFVIEAVPSLCQQLKDGMLTKEKIVEEIDAAIANPTEAMRKSFRALSAAQKSVLYALTDSNWGAWDTVAERYSKLVPEPKADEQFTLVVDELTQAFIKVARANGNGGLLNWVHPSVRDLVIDELGTVGNERRRFLTAGSINAVLLALSDVGGESGQRRRPLLVDAQDWQCLQDTCERLIASGGHEEILRLVDALDEAAEGIEGSERAYYDSLVRRVCLAFSARWNAAPELNSWRLLERFTRLSTNVRPFSPAPDLEALWTDALEAAHRAKGDEVDIEANERAVVDFLRAVRAIAQLEPRFLTAMRFPETHEALLQQLENQILGYRAADYGSYLDDAADTMRDLLAAVQLGQEVGAIAELCHRVGGHVASTTGALDSEQERRREEDDSDYDIDRADKPDFDDTDIDAVLSDLEPSVG